MWLQHRTESWLESGSPRLMTFCMIMGSYLKNNLKTTHLFLTKNINSDSIKTTTWNTSHPRHFKFNSMGNSDPAMPFLINSFSISSRQLICRKYEVLMQTQQRNVVPQNNHLAVCLCECVN